MKLSFKCNWNNSLITPTQNLPEGQRRTKKSAKILISLFWVFFKTLQKKVVPGLFYKIIFGTFSPQAFPFQNTKRVCAKKRSFFHNKSSKTGYFRENLRNFSKFIKRWFWYSIGSRSITVSQISLELQNTFTLYTFILLKSLK